MTRTIPDVWLERSRKAADRVSVYYKEEGRWVGRTFAEGEVAVRELSAGLAGLGLELAAIALVTVPVAALWIGIGLTLGARQSRLAAVI